jgi:hypothetical protein
MGRAALIGIASVIAARFWWPAGTWLCLLVAGACCLAWLAARTAAGPWLAGMTLAAYAARALLAAALFAISAAGLPWFQSMQGRPAADFGGLPPTPSATTTGP